MLRLATFAVVCLWASAVVAPQAASAQERVALPTTDSGANIAGIQISDTNYRTACLDGTLNNSVMACPNDCMIPTSNVSITTLNVCDAASVGQWQCKWPTQWVTKTVSCDDLTAHLGGRNGGTLTNTNGTPATGATSGWAGSATVRKEYEIQQCGAVLTATNQPWQLVDVSQCTRNRAEPMNHPCPENTNAYLADQISGTVGESWRTATADEKPTNWAGAGVNLTRPLVEGLTPTGQVEHRSAGPWAVASVACQRPMQREVVVPCGGSMVNQCTVQMGPNETRLVTVASGTTTFISGTEMVRITSGTQVMYKPYVPAQCALVAAGNLTNACVKDMAPGSITVNSTEAAVHTANPDGTYRYGRSWSYNTSRYQEYTTTCAESYEIAHTNRGVANIVQGLENSLTTFAVVSTEYPNLLQEYCSQAYMTTAWTTYDYSGTDSGGGSSGGDGGSSGGGCGCGGGDAAGGGEGGCGGNGGGDGGGAE